MISGKSTLDSGLTRQELYREMLRVLSEAEIEYAETECGFIIEFVTGMRYMEYVKLHPLEKADLGDAEKALAICHRRANGEPLQYIFGEWDFFGLTFKVGRGVLIPRADTEILVEKALELISDREDIKMIDLCSGSGCIPAAVVNVNGKVIGYALEKSEEAFPYLEENLSAHAESIKPVLCDVLDEETVKLYKDIDIITANPPYLTDRDMAELQEEVKHEPVMALHGGSDGLYFYREIASLWKNALKDGGWLVFEMGLGQYRDVMEIMAEQGYMDISYACDYAGIERVVFGRK